ncbi:MAG: Txe/YoeB family addiction module toxin, partial [Nitrospira sp.]
TAERRQRGSAEVGQVKLIFAEEAWEDYLYWLQQDRRMVERINKLIRETQRQPFAGMGKPEPLKHALSGFWSRRITDEHRMVYRVESDALMIAQLRFHY